MLIDLIRRLGRALPLYCRNPVCDKIVFLRFSCSRAASRRVQHTRLPVSSLLVKLVVHAVWNLDRCTCSHQTHEDALVQGPQVAVVDRLGVAASIQRAAAVTPPGLLDWNVLCRRRRHKRVFLQLQVAMCALTRVLLLWRRRTKFVLKHGALALPTDETFCRAVLFPFPPSLIP